MDAPKHENVVNASFGGLGVAWVWMMSHLDIVNSLCTAAASMGGVILVYFTISRAIVGRRRDRIALEREEIELRQVKELMTADRSLHVVPKQEPAGELEE